MTYNNNSWVVTELVGKDILDVNIMKVIEEQVFFGWLKSVFDELWFVQEQVEIADGIFTSMLWTYGLEELGETEQIPLIGQHQWYEKGYKMKRYAGKVATTRAAEEWFKKWLASDKMSPDVKIQLSKIISNVKRLVDASKVTKDEIATEVLTNWFDATKSFYPDGQPLFSANHVIKYTGETQSNLVTGALTEVKLLEAIQKLENMKDWLGRTMRSGTVYKLVVPKALRPLAIQVLNNSEHFASKIASTGTEANNSVTVNLFAWNGYDVEIVVLESLNQPKGNGTKVGNATQWFVIDPVRAREMAWLKLLVLYYDMVNNYFDNETKVTYYDIDFSLCADFYNYEFIVWSTGV